MKKDTSKNSGQLEAIEKHREAIDEIDAQIVSLLAERVNKAAETGRIKKEAGLPLVDPVREAEVLDRVASLAGNRLDSRVLRRIYGQIIEAARSVQQLPKVGFLGPAGTFTHQAATLFFKGSFSFIPCPHFVYGMYFPVSNGKNSVWGWYRLKIPGKVRWT
jgi:chorismate mutase/prephenate dehydratase